MLKILDLAFTNIQPEGLTYLQDLRGQNKALVVDGNEAAVDVAKKVADQKAEQVIVMDDQHKVLGVIVKPYIDDQLLSQSQQSAYSLSDGIVKLAQGRRIQPSDLPTRVRPQLFYCVKGKHFTSEDPCSVHP